MIWVTEMRQAKVGEYILFNGKTLKVVNHIKEEEKEYRIKGTESEVERDVILNHPEYNKEHVKIGNEVKWLELPHNKYKVRKIYEEKIGIEDRYKYLTILHDEYIILPKENKQNINFEAEEEIKKGMSEATTPRETKYEQLAIKIGQLVDEKNLAYGDSANTSAEAFKLLYPNGITQNQYEDALLLVRIWDKMKRIATRKDTFGESPYQDIAGYSLIGAMMDEKK